MLSKSQIKYIRSLHSKKFRLQHQRYIAEGPKVVNELLIPNGNIEQIFATKSYIGQSTDLSKSSFEVIEIKSDELAKISTLKSPNEVLAVVKMDTINKPPTEIGEHNLVLALDGINDPGNLGTIIRAADWFGIKQIVCSDNCVDVYNPKTVQSTMGSIAHVKVCYTDLGKWLSELNQTPVYAADLRGNNLYDTQLKRGVLIVGSESHGISPKITELASHKIVIPKYGKAESLNAAMATGIILSHYRNSN